MSKNIIFRDSNNTFLIILTAIYVSLTFFMLLESRKQNKLLLQSNKNIQKAYLNIKLLDLINQPQIKANKYPIFIGECTAKYQVINEGQTIAYPIFSYGTIDSLSPGKVNYRDSLLNTQIVMDSTHKGWVTSTLLPKDEIKAGVKILNIFTNSEGYVFIHLYYVYKDVFGDYHDCYSITPYIFDISRKGCFRLPPIIRIHDFNKKETSIFVNKYKL